LLNINAIAALSDNYIWTMQQPGATHGNHVAIVDPGDAEPILNWLHAQGLRIGAILITHHHADHTGGMQTLLAQRQLLADDDIPVYGPAAESDRIPGITHTLGDGDEVEVGCLGTAFRVIEVPGHTLGHIAFHGAGILLAGDTLFRGGCGRVFEGTPEQMQHALARLRELPDETRVHAGHEYTRKNLAFARMVEPDNQDIAQVAAEVDALLAAGRPTLPGTIGEECLINPFLRWDSPDVIQAASKRAGRALTEPAAIFAELRAWKDAS